MKTNYNVEYNNEEGFVYKLTNKKDGKWYVGKSEADINIYATSSRNVDLLKGISEGNVDREIIYVGSKQDIESWEKQWLTENDAANDPMSYNRSNGISSLDKPLDFKAMQLHAQSIIDDHSICGVNAEWVELDKIITSSNMGELAPTSILNDLGHIQVRDERIMQKHVRKLRDLFDDNQGNLENIDQNFLVVILEDRVWGDKSGDKLIGGAHTLEAAITSNFVFKIRILRIPKSVHSSWLDEEVRALGLLLNPRDRLVKNQTGLDDLIKNLVDLHIINGIQLNSTIMKDYKNTFCHTRTEKDWVTKKVKQIVDDINAKNRNYIPSNIIDYSDPKEKEVLDKKIKDLMKDKTVFAKSFTTGKANVFDYAATILHNIYHKKSQIKTFHAIIWHPDRKRKDIWKSKYLAGFKDLKKCLKDGVGVDLQLEEMAFERSENT